MTSGRRSKAQRRQARTAASAPLSWHGTPVPFVAVWTGEKLQGGRGAAAVSPAGLIDPPAGRLGWHWMPYRDAPGRGTPLFGEVHCARQIASMLDGLCQVCGQPLGGERTWVLSGQDAPDDLEEGETFLTPTPPTCRSCMLVAARYCPHLRRLDRIRYLRAGRVDAVAVMGQRGHYASAFGPDAAFRIDDEAARPFVLARQLIVSIQQWRWITP